MKLSRKEKEFAFELIEEWEKNSLLDDKKGKELRNSIIIQPFDWRRLASYAFFFAVGSMVMSFVALFLDDWVVKMLHELYDAPNVLKLLFFVALSALFFWLASRKKRQKPYQIFTIETFYLLGILSSATSLGYLGVIVDDSWFYYTIILLLAVIFYAVLGVYLRSKLIWCFSLLAFAAWYGIETGYLSSWNDRLLGMNYLLRYLLFSIALFPLVYRMKKLKRLSEFYHLTYSFCLFTFFFVLWALSVVGNSAGYEEWKEARQMEFFTWAFVLGTASGLSIWFGLKQDNTQLRDYGLVFLFINLFTRYVEYGWSFLPKAVFFGLLAVLFFGIGKFSERLWVKK